MKSCASKWPTEWKARRENVRSSDYFRGTAVVRVNNTCLLMNPPTPNKGHRKTSPISPCGFCVNRNTLEWQDFLNWKHTWEGPFKNSAAGPIFFSWGQKPALVLKGQAFQWVPEAQISSPVPMEGLCSPSTPRGPGRGREDLERKAHSQQLALVRWGQWGFLGHTL